MIIWKKPATKTIEQNNKKFYYSSVPNKRPGTLIRNIRVENSFSAYSVETSFSALSVENSFSALSAENKWAVCPPSTRIPPSTFIKHTRVAAQCLYGEQVIVPMYAMYAVEHLSLIHI